MVTLKNPLTLEEKLSLTKLFDHDSSTLLSILANQAYLVQEKGEKIDFQLLYLTLAIDCFERCVSCLCREDEISLRSDFPPARIKDPSDFLDILQNVPLYNPKYEVQQFRPFLSHLPTLVSVLHNLLKNPGQNTRRLRVEPSGFPVTPTLVPKGARDHDRFIAFRVWDNGPGFHQDRDLQDYFRKCPSNGNNGFGLYFTGLAAKVLRAPIEISSAPGDTTVSFYHPIFAE